MSLNTLSAPSIGDNAVAPVTIEQLIFVGFNGYTAALDRDTGAIVWSNNQMHKGYVTMLLDDDRLIVFIVRVTICGGNQAPKQFRRAFFAAWQGK